MDRKSTQPFSVKQWMLFTSLGWILGVVLILLLAELSEAFAVTIDFPLGVGLGLGIGFMQWLVLRKYVETSFKWIGLTVLGLSFPFVLYDICSQLFCIPEIWLFLNFGIGGVVSGYLQYRFFLIALSKKSKCWLWYSFYAWCLCLLLNSFPFIPYYQQLKKSTKDIINIITIFGSGPLFGLITGMGMVIILRAINNNSFDKK